MEATDAILMDVMEQRGRDMNEYKGEVLDWSYESIFEEGD